MRNPSGYQGENERVEKSEQQQVRHFFHKTCNQEVFGSFTFWPCKTTAKKCTKKVCCTCKVVFLLNRPIYCCFFTILVAFAAQHNMILYFVRANYKYYRELHPQPWLNLYIREILAAQLTDTHRLLPVLFCAIPGIVPPVSTLKTAPVD